MNKINQKYIKNIILLAVTLSSISFLLLYFFGIDYSAAKEGGYLTSLLISTTASITGLIGAVLLFWQTILSSKKIMSVFTRDVFWLQDIHTFLGKYGIFLILLHPIFIFFAYNKNWDLFLSILPTTEFAEHVAFGRIALLLWLVIWLTSAVVREKVSYRPWKYLHYLSYPIRFLVILHAGEIGNFVASNVVVQVIWWFMVGAFIFTTVWRALEWAGFLKAKYEVVSTQKVGDSIVLVKMKPTGKKMTTPLIGQHAYVQFGRFGENHPYTIMEWDEMSGGVQIGVREVGKFSKLLMNAQPGQSIFIDGPYGTYTLEGQNDIPKVIIAGGVGITPFTRLVRDYPKNTLFINCNRTYKDIVDRQELQQILGSSYFDVMDSETQPDNNNVLVGRLDAQKIIQIVGQQNLQKYNYFICGSPGFIGAIEKTITGLGLDESKVYYETLG